MRPAAVRSPQTPEKRRPQLLDLKERQTVATALVQQRKKVDQQTVTRVVDNETDELLAGLHRAQEEATKAGQILRMAEWSGSEQRADQLRYELNKLAKAAVI